MFRRNEKKIKAVFKLQFQATQVPQLKEKKLMITLVPVDVGKPTARLPKAPILEGACTWEKPVYETVKMVKETKTGRIREKFYYIVVSTGTSKSGFLGEISIDFADLVDADKPVNLVLPLQTSKSGTILHVNVQKIQGERSDSRHHDVSETTCDQQKDPMSPESDELSEEASLHDEERSLDDGGESENSNSETRSGVKESSHEMLIAQIKTLERKVEVSELEMQALRKQIVKETRKVEQLTMQAVSLQEEKEALKGKCEQMKTSRTWDDEGDGIRDALGNTKRELQHQKLSNQKLKLQLQDIEDSNSEYVLAMRDLTRKLDQKEAEIAQLSSNIKALKGGSKEAASSSKRNDRQEETRISRDVEKYNRNAEEADILKQNMEKLKAELEFHKNEKAKILMEAQRLTEDYESLEMENKKMYSELEQREREKMEIEKCCEDLSSEVEHFKLQVAKLEEENERQEFQYIESLKVIDSLEGQVDSLQKELKRQEQLSEQDLEALNMTIIELEKKLVRSEEALRKTRRSNADTIQKLQEEIQQVYAENSRNVEEYEELAQQANAEADNLQKENEILKEHLHEAEKELQILRNQHEVIHDVDTRINEETAKCKHEMEEEDSKSRNGTDVQQMWNLEKEDLERQLTSVLMEAERLTKENTSMKSQINQKSSKEENLHLEVRKLRLKNNEAKNQLLELKSEKGSLKKEISKLQGDLRKKEQKPVQVVQDGERPYSSAKTEFRNSQNPSEQRSCCHIEGSSDNPSSPSEVVSLKERIRRMEQELKEMHERYSEISLKFAEVEGERQQLVMSLRNLKGGKKS